MSISTGAIASADMTIFELAEKAGCNVYLQVDGPRVIVSRGHWSREFSSVRAARAELLQRWADQLLTRACRVQAEARRWGRGY